MFSLAGIPPLFGFWPKLLVFNAAVAQRLCRAGGRRHRRHRDRRLLLSEDRQGDVLGRARASPTPGFGSRCRALLILLAALLVSPLGYLLIGPLGGAHRPRRGVDLLTRIRIVERTGSTNADILADDQTPSKATGWSRSSRSSGKGRQGRAWVSAPGNFFGSTLVEAAARRSAGADAVARRRAGADRSGRCRSAGPAADAQMAQRPDAAGQEARRHPARAQRRPDCRRLWRQPGDGSGRWPTARPQASARKVAPQAFAPLLAGSFARLLDLWRASEPGLLAHAWLARAHPLGTPAYRSHAARMRRSAGRFAGLEPDGALRLARGRRGDRDRPRRGCRARLIAVIFLSSESCYGRVIVASEFEAFDGS